MLIKKRRTGMDFSMKGMNSVVKLTMYKPARHDNALIPTTPAEKCKKSNEKPSAETAIPNAHIQQRIVSAAILEIR
jgi:hypothetical protein